MFLQLIYSNTADSYKLSNRKLHSENKWFVQDFGAFVEASGSFQVPVVMG